MPLASWNHVDTRSLHSISKLHYLEYLVTCVRDIFHDIFMPNQVPIFSYMMSKGLKPSSFNGQVDTLKKNSCRNLQQKRRDLIDFLTFSADMYNPRYFTLKSYLLSARSILSSKNHQKHLMIKKLERHCFYQKKTKFMKIMWIL